MFQSVYKSSTFWETKKMSSFPNFSLLTGCLQALITWAELCSPFCSILPAKWLASLFLIPPPFPSSEIAT